MPVSIGAFETNGARGCLVGAVLALMLATPAPAPTSLSTPALDRFAAAQRGQSDAGFTLATQDMLDRCRTIARADASQLPAILNARPPFLTGLEFDLEQVIANVNLLRAAQSRLGAQRDGLNLEIARILARPAPRSDADEARLAQLTRERNGLFRQIGEVQANLAVARAKNGELRVAIAEANRIQDGVNTCVQQRRTQLAGGGGQVGLGPDVRIVSAPSPEPARLADWAGQVGGSWAGSCLYDGQPYASPSGAFNLSFDGRGNITGAFVQGAASSIRGSVVLPTGALLAGGSVVMDGAELGLNLSGAVRRNPTGGLSAAGVFNANDGKGLTCTGQWQG